MAFLPDILDHLGKTPREFGALHLHVEPILRADDGAACAVLWIQAAFAPIKPGGTLQVMGTTLPIPRLDDGQVLRAKLPLQIAPGPAELSFGVGCTATPRAERVRPAWLLFDTFQIPTLSEMRPSNADEGLGVGGLLVANVLSLPLGIAVIPTGLGGSRSLSETVATTVHRARELPSGFVASIVAGQPERVDAPEWTEIWRPGQPLPAAPSHLLPTARPPAAARSQSGRRECSHCRFSGKREDFGSDRYCPECGHEWD